MSDVATENASVVDYPTKCPHCNHEPVKLVTLGDPNAPKESTVSKTADATVEVLTHFQFLSCPRCKESWDLPKQPKA